LRQSRTDRCILEGAGATPAEEREVLACSVTSLNVPFPLIHRTGVVASSAGIGEGVILCPFVLVSDHVVLADFVMMNF
jgi:hypothetical protein